MKKIIYLILIILSIGCSRYDCPTTNKRHFMKGVRPAKALYKRSSVTSKRKTPYIVPYKYRKEIKNYGNLRKN